MKKFLALTLAVLMMLSMLVACTPAEPVDPAPVDPVDPVDPADPADPVDPVDPAPVEPTEPEDPDPAEPDPVDPDPVEPTEPEDPAPAEPDPVEPPVEEKPYPEFPPIDDPDFDYMTGISNGMAFYQRVIITNALDLDTEYLYENACSANNNFRFADKTAYMIYKFDLTKFPNAVFTFNIVQNYFAEISPDGQNWEMVADYSEGGTVPEHNAGKNNFALVVNPAEYGYTDTLYFRLSDCYTHNGWGGSLRNIQIDYSKATTITALQLEAPYYTVTKNGQFCFTRIVPTTAEAKDVSFIVENTAQVNNTQRYCDGHGYVIYKFDLTGMTSCNITMTLLQNYTVSISKDGTTWEMIADASEGGTIPHMTDGGNLGDMTVDLFAYGSETGATYIKIGNSYPGKGHGGSIKSFTLDYTRAAE